MPGQLFAESFACMRGSVLNVSVVTDAPSVVLYLNVRQLLTTCSSACEFHNRVIMNLLSDLADKNLSFNEKLTHMAQRTTREKLLSYLSAESIRQDSQVFDIAYNRQQLADYLSVDRSAMSNELCKLRDEGIIALIRTILSCAGKRRRCLGSAIVQSMRVGYNSLGGYTDGSVQ